MNASANYLAVMPDCRGNAYSEACKARVALGFDGRASQHRAYQKASDYYGAAHPANASKALTMARDAKIAALLTAQEELQAADRALASHQRSMEGGA